MKSSVGSSGLGGAAPGAREAVVEVEVFDPRVAESASAEKVGVLMRGKRGSGWWCGGGAQGGAPPGAPR